MNWNQLLNFAYVDKDAFGLAHHLKLTLEAMLPKNKIEFHPGQTHHGVTVVGRTSEPNMEGILTTAKFRREGKQPAKYGITKQLWSHPDFPDKRVVHTIHHEMRGVPGQGFHQFVVHDSL